MHDYNIATSADNDIFEDVCGKIENSASALTKEKLLIDVDGSLIQRYASESEKITVFNDYEVDAVYVKSSIELPILSA